MIMPDQVFSFTFPELGLQPCGVFVCLFFFAKTKKLEWLLENLLFVSNLKLNTQNYFHRAEEGIYCWKVHPENGSAGFYHAQLGGKSMEHTWKKPFIVSNSVDMHWKMLIKWQWLDCQWWLYNRMGLLPSFRSSSKCTNLELLLLALYKLICNVIQECQSDHRQDNDFRHS